MESIIVLGSGGHAKVVIETLQLLQINIVGIASHSQDLYFQGIPIIGEDDAVLKYNPKDVLLVNAIGSIGNTRLRNSVYHKFKEKSYSFFSVIHPSAVVSPSVIIGEGVQVMAGSIIQTDVKIGNNVIVNTKSSIDHDCIIKDHVHIAPGCTLSGNVIVGEGTHLGTNTTVIQNISIGKEVVCGAGSVIIRDITNNKKVMGVPGKVIKS